jgi:hypothetical protein
MINLQFTQYSIGHREVLSYKLHILVPSNTQKTTNIRVSRFHGVVHRLLILNFIFDHESLRVIEDSH